MGFAYFESCRISIINRVTSLASPSGYSSSRGSLQALSVGANDLSHVAVEAVADALEGAELPLFPMESTTPQHPLIALLDTPYTN